MLPPVSAPTTYAMPTSRAKGARILKCKNDNETTSRFCIMNSKTATENKTMIVSQSHRKTIHPPGQIGARTGNIGEHLRALR